MTARAQIFYQGGFSLIELMVAITLGLMITTTLGYILVGSRATYSTQGASARVQDTGRFALEFIGRQLRAAGRIDITPLGSDPRTKLSGLPADWTPIIGTHGGGAEEGVEAVNASGVVSINGGTRQTDTLTVQYQETTLGGNSPRDCNGAAVPLNNLPGGAAYQYGTIRNTISLDGANLELECAGNGGGGSQPLTERVEDLQFRYAETGAPSVFQDASQVNNWANVVAVQICIMVQSTENGVISAPQSIRNCSGEFEDEPPADTRLRRTFTSVFTLRNRQ